MPRKKNSAEERRSLNLFNLISAEEFSLQTYETGIPLFDLIGGIPAGMTYVVGAPGAGKSSLAIQIAGALYKKYAMPTVYLDTEMAVTNERVLQLTEMNEKEWIKVISVHDYYELVQEDKLSLSRKLYKIYKQSGLTRKEFIEKYFNEYKLFVVWDSVEETTLPRTEDLSPEELDPQKTGPVRARWNSMISRDILKLYSFFNLPVFVINQIRDKVQINRFKRDITINGEDFHIPGGKALLHENNLLITVLRRAKIDDERKWVDVIVLKSKISSPKKFKMVFNDKRGFDIAENLFFILLDEGYINKSGRKYIIDSEVGLNEEDSSGMKDALIEKIRKNIDIVNKFFIKNISDNFVESISENEEVDIKNKLGLT